MLSIARSDIAHFSDIKKRNFLLIVSQQASDLGVCLRSSAPLAQEQIAIIDNPDINAILGSDLANDADILYIPYGFINWPFPEIKTISPRSRLIGLITREDHCETNQATLADHLKRLKMTDIQGQSTLGDCYVSKLECSEYLKLVNNHLETAATLELCPEYVANKLYGYVKPGEKILAPNGEVSLTPRDATRKKLFTSSYANPPCLKLNGEIILHGHPIVNRQAPIQFTPNSVISELYQQLSTLRDGRLKAQLVDGVISDLVLIDECARPAYQALTALFLLDSRYRSLLEIGYGIDRVNQPGPGNNLANEFYGADNGTIHFGIGSSVTNYHIDILCPDTQVKFI